MLTASFSQELQYDTTSFSTPSVENFALRCLAKSAPILHGMMA